MSTLTSKGQVTIPRHIREEMNLQPGSQVEFCVNEKGDIVVSKAGAKPSRKPDRFERVRGKAGNNWRTDELMTLLRGED